MIRTSASEALTVIDGVRVRWRYSREGGCRYLCDMDGEMTVAACSHAYSAALEIAETTLGIQAATYQETA